MKQSTSNKGFESIFYCPWTIVKESGLEVFCCCWFVCLFLFSEDPLVKPNYLSENSDQMEIGSGLRTGNWVPFLSTYWDHKRLSAVQAQSKKLQALGVLDFTGSAVFRRSYMPSFPSGSSNISASCSLEFPEHGVEGFDETIPFRTECSMVFHSSHTLYCHGCLHFVLICCNKNLL